MIFGEACGCIKTTCLRLSQDHRCRCRPTSAAPATGLPRTSRWPSRRTSKPSTSGAPLGVGQAGQRWSGRGSPAVTARTGHPRVTGTATLPSVRSASGSDLMFSINRHIFSVDNEACMYIRRPADESKKQARGPFAATKHFVL